MRRRFTPRRVIPSILLERSDKIRPMSRFALLGLAQEGISEEIATRTIGKPLLSESEKRRSQSACSVVCDIQLFKKEIG